MWYVGYEPKRNPQSRWAITFIPRNNKPKRSVTYIINNYITNHTVCIHILVSISHKLRHFQTGIAIHLHLNHDWEKLQIEMIIFWLIQKRVVNISFLYCRSKERPWFGCTIAGAVTEDQLKWTSAMMFGEHANILPTPRLVITWGDAARAEAPPGHVRLVLSSLRRGRSPREYLVVHHYMLFDICIVYIYISFTCILYCKSYHCFKTILFLRHLYWLWLSLRSFWAAHF